MAILENDKFKNSGKSSKKKNCGHWNDNKNDKFLNLKKKTNEKVTKNPALPLP